MLMLLTQVLSYKFRGDGKEKLSLRLEPNYRKYWIFFRCKSEENKWLTDN